MVARTDALSTGSGFAFRFAPLVILQAHLLRSIACTTIHHSGELWGNNLNVSPANFPCPPSYLRHLHRIFHNVTSSCITCGAGGISPRKRHCSSNFW